MEPNYFDLDLPALIACYARESALLRNALLEGKGWEEVQEQRRRLINIETAMHRCTPTHPAEQPGDRSARSAS